MGTYQIVTDSTADLTPELIRQLDVQVIPLCYMMGGRTYHNIPGGGEMTDREFYAKLRGGAMSTTTQINSEEFLRVFTPLLEAGQDVLYIAFSSGLSGTCQSAQLAREELQKRFPQRKMVVFDSLCASMGEGLLVYYAAKLRQEGKSLEEVLAWLQENVLRLCHWFTVDDLNHLKRGGRVSTATALVGTMLGINAAFLVCTLLCLIGLVMTIALVKDKPGEEAAVDEGGTRKSLLTSIMKTDVYSLSREATVEEAMRLFVEKNISAAPIVDESGEPVGFISDGDILKRLSPRSNSFTDPIVLINSTVNDDEGYDEKLAKVMQMRASEIGAASPICVSVHANLTDVCRVLSENHLKKVPVLEAGHIVGIINRSDITQYSMAAYLADHPERAVYCGEGPSGQYECVEEACEEC